MDSLQTNRLLTAVLTTASETQFKLQLGKGRSIEVFPVWKKVKKRHVSS